MEMEDLITKITRARALKAAAEHDVLEATRELPKNLAQCLMSIASVALNDPESQGLADLIESFNTYSIPCLEEINNAGYDMSEIDDYLRGMNDAYDNKFYDKVAWNALSAATEFAWAWASRDDQ